MQKLLIIDDEPNVAYSLTKALSRDGLEIQSADTAGSGMSRIRAWRPQAVILDVRLPDRSGLELFEEIREIDTRLPVIVMTALSTMQVAVEAMKRGAYEFVLKPVELVALRELVECALEAHGVPHDPVLAVEEDHVDIDDLIVGRSPAIQEVFKAIGRVAPAAINVLILGESGSGKELVSRAIHAHSDRATRPCLAMNCAALPESTLESELFGHEKGAFTGADRQRQGKFEQADGGTLFLDEIGDMSPTTQAKVLRLLQDGSFQRMGSNQTLRSDVRVLAATNRDLEAMVREGTFREDLYYRLSGFVIRIPPLRERIEDLPLLIRYFTRRFNRELGREVRSFSAEALRCLENHHWPGNIRELQNVIRHAFLHSVAELVTSGSLPEHLRGGSLEIAGADSAHPSALQLLTRNLLDRGDRNIYRHVHLALDRSLLPQVLDHVDGSQVQAAQLLGISRSTLRARLAELELVVEKKVLPEVGQPVQ